MSVAAAPAALDPGGTDWAAWVGAIGTWVIGVIAAWIAAVQYRHNKFRPEVWAFCDSAKRILVRIVNQGAGSGLITDVNLLGPDHLENGEVQLYWWELQGEQNEERPVPFPLAGNSTAQLVLIPDPGVSMAGLSVRVDFGGGRDSGCRRIVAVPARLYGTTVIPGVTPPIAATEASQASATARAASIGSHPREGHTPSPQPPDGAGEIPSTS
jgi:hypothetical protein